MSEPDASANVEVPEFARGSYTQEQWNALDPERRRGLIDANIRSSQPSLASGLLRQAVQTGNFILEAYSRYNDEEREHALRMAEIEGQRQLLTIAEQSRTEQGRTDPRLAAQAAEIQQGLQRLAAERQRLRESRKTVGMSTTTTTLLAVGGVALFGVVVYFAVSSLDKSSDKPRANPRKRKHR